MKKLIALLVLVAITGTYAANAQSSAPTTAPAANKGGDLEKKKHHHHHHDHDHDHDHGGKDGKK
jgi:hypothetical protein